MKYYRYCINIIDNLLVFLLNLRFSVVLKIGQYKKKHNIPVLDNNREKALVEKLSKKEKYPNMVEKIWTNIFNFSRSLQNKE